MKLTPAESGPKLALGPHSLVLHDMNCINASFDMRQRFVHKVIFNSEIDVRTYIDENHILIKAKLQKGIVSADMVYTFIRLVRLIT